MALWLLLQLVVAGLRPDLTPGAATPTTTRAAVCATPWRADGSSDVPAPVWEHVLARYGLTWAQRGAYLPTLAIPSALGGLRVTDNVWPAAKASEWNQARKQRVERAVYDALCGGRIQLPEAQNRAGVAWEIGWREYFGR